jgi:hypothetical protein
VTIAKPKLLETRRLLLQHLDIHRGNVAADLDPAEVGINGGPAHVAGGTSYHLGKDQLKLAKRPYSVYESPRDQRGLNNYSSGVDIGEFQVTTAKGTFGLPHFSAWLVNLCRQGDPDTKDIREVIYSLNGRTVRRWDSLGKRTSGDGSHRWHTHVSIFRDADGSCMVRLVTRYLQHIGLVAGEDDDMTPQQAQQLRDAHYVTAVAIPNPTGEGRVPLHVWAGWMTGAVKALASAVGGVDEATKAQLQQDLTSLQAGLAAVPGEVVEELEFDDKSPEEIAVRLRARLGDKAAAVGAILAAG